MSLCPVSLLSCVDNYVVFYVLCQCFMFLMSLCPVSLLSCVDNCVVLCPYVLMFLCPVSLLSCVDNYVVLSFVCVYVFNVFVSYAIAVLC